jgi:hypothetical protein
MRFGMPRLFPGLKLFSAVSMPKNSENVLYCTASDRALRSLQK